MAKTAPAAGPILLPADSLIPYGKNARTHSESQIAQIGASLEEFGFAGAIVTRGGVIAKGHGTTLAIQNIYAAGKRLYPAPGKKHGAQPFPAGQVPVLVADGWTDKQFRAFVIADNKLALNAGWDDALLAAELAALEKAGVDMALLGFTEAELAQLTAEPGLTDPEEAPPVPEAPVLASGQYWHLGKHRLLIGDSTDPAAVKRLLGGAKPNLMATDPPYGVNYDPAWRARAGVNKSKAKLGKVLNDDRADWTPAWELFPGDVAYVWHGGLHSGEVEQSLRNAGFGLRAQIIWAKDRFVLSRGDYHWRHEPCWYAVRVGKKGCWAGDRKQDTVWNIPARDDAGHGHGTQKPIECMRRPILNNTKPGEAVYDPFCGSGTTLMAAEMEQRVCYACEINPAYAQVIIERWQAYSGKPALLDGKTPFAAIVAASKPKGRKG